MAVLIKLRKYKYVCFHRQEVADTLKPNRTKMEDSGYSATRPTILIPDRLIYIYTPTLQNQTSGGHIIGRISALNTRGKKKKKKSYNNRPDVKLKSHNRGEEEL